MDYLVVVDMQNDFITGALANENTQKILPKIKNKIENFKGTVIYVQTTHFGDYMDTQDCLTAHTPLFLFFFLNHKA